MNKSDSREQQLMERVVFERVQEKLKIKLEKNPKISVGDSHLSYIQPDFYSKEYRIIGEIFVHIGATKKAQNNKISNDIMKMLLLDKKHNMLYRKIIVLCDDNVIKKLTGKSWLSECIREFDIEILKIDLTDEERYLIRNAQNRQVMK